MNDFFASRLIPLPQEMKIKDNQADNWVWDNDITVVIQGDDEQDRFAAETLIHACRERQLPEPKMVIAENAVGEDAIAAVKGKCICIGDPTLFLSLGAIFIDESFTALQKTGDQGYFIQVRPDRILVAGNSAAGVFYGVQTLIQLLPEKMGEGIPAIEITDWPTVPERGVTMDFGRGEVYTTEYIKENIRRLAHYKMNVLILYLEDAFLFPSHPDIGEDRDRLTTEEAQELDAFARKYHVDLIPCFDSPGHMNRMLAHPNYAYLAEKAGQSSEEMVINLNHPDTYPLLRDLYTAMCRAFPSTGYMHLGGDEAVVLGKGGTKPLADQIGIGSVFVRHIKKIREFVEPFGKRLVVWGDPFEPGFFKAFGLKNYGVETLALIPRDVIISSWHYGPMPEFPFGNEVAELGFEQHIQSSFGDIEIFPSVNAAAQNVETFIPYAHTLKARAAIHSSWNDTNVSGEYNWPVAAFFGEWAWKNPGRPWAEALPVAVENFYGPGTAGVADAICFLGDINRYFGWAAVGLSMAGFNLFFDPMEPRAMSEDAQKRLQQFRQDWVAAKDKFVAARKKAMRNESHLDFFEFSFAQQKAIADMVECRHLLAQGDTESKENLKKLAATLSREFDAVAKQYQELWHRADRPKGLEPNKKRYEKQLAALNGLARSS